MSAPSPDNVVKLDLVSVGEGYRLEADTLLDGAKEYAFERMCIIGKLEDGSMYIAGTANAGETLILMEWAKHDLLFGED